MVRVSRAHNQNNSIWKFAKFKILASFVFCSLCFYGGTLTGMYAAVGGLAGNNVKCHSEGPGEGAEGERSAGKARMMEELIQKRVDEELMKKQQEQQFKKEINTKNTKFQKSTSSFLTGAARTTKESFKETFDMGVPDDPIDQGASDVLILYQTKTSLPTSDNTLNSAALYNDPNIGIPLAPTANIATENCGTMNVLLTSLSHGKQCTAIVGNYESYHVQKWMRVPEPENRNKQNKGQVDSSLPLRMVGRGYNTNGRDSFSCPNEKQINYHWGMFGPYLDGADDALNFLKPIVQKIARNGVVIVQTCNFGQSELLMNFVCSAKSRGLDISNVLVFATDKETRDLAKGLGLEVFYDEKIYGNIPAEEAKQYGDRKFAAMMYAKVICVQMILMLGYDVLFQDVDIVWYKDPLSYLQNSDMIDQNFDIYFQDDGSRQTRYAPYSANSGFYYVRHNDRTTYLFTALLYAGDAIKAVASHQQVLVGLLAEHSSLFGLRVKILSKLEDGFPGGWHYHQSKSFMRRFVNGETDSYLFHMSWTKNKDDKMLFFRQMGDWFVNDKCISKKVEEIVGVEAAGSTVESGSLPGPCCAAEPLLSCHYKDKPSKIPCRDSPPIDKYGNSFW